MWTVFVLYDADMDLSVGRLLTLIELLQVYRQLNAEEIAGRLEVSPRTVRRYITGLQEMGIPIEAERGPAGGYRLRRGPKLPPLMLSNDEALVTVIGLLAAQRLGLSASGAAVQGALAKLDRVLPETQRTQVQAMQDFVSLGLSPVARDHADAETILRLSTAARDQSGIRLTYRSAAGEVTERLVDPYGVAFQSGHWYLVSWDHLRDALRTFRLDRMLATEVTNATFQRPEDFDVVAYLRQAIGEAVYGTRCEVLLALSFDAAKSRVSPTDGTLEEAEAGTLLRFSADDLDWAASFLAGLECDLVVLHPAELRASLRAMGARLQAAARGPGRRRAGVTGQAP
jgi:predicted DNA-binding transcriptional regulator YafY